MTTIRVLEEAGFSEPVWIEGVKSRSKAMGCALAHRNALQYILEKNIFPALVVEDDILIHHRHEKVIVPDSADALYLGLSEYGIHGGKGVRRHAAERVSKDIHRLQNMLAAHAIVYFTKEYVEHLLHVNDIFVAMQTNQDKGRAETMKYWNVYGLSVPMFYQAGRYEEYTRITLPNPKMVSLDSFYRV